MKKYLVFSLVLILFIPGLIKAQEQAAETPRLDQLFVKVTIYPTASLSRYDYNNDIDLYEIRAYVEIRDKSPTGDLINDAQVFINSVLLEYRNDRYEKRIKVSSEDPIGEIDLRINTADERQIKQSVPIPSWLILENPQPVIFDSGEDLKISWRFSKGSCSVDVSVYNFKTGDAILTESNVEGSELVIPASKIPGSSIVRVFVMQSWYYKRYLRGNDLVRGSEITLIPWSQVFLRSR